MSPSAAEAAAPELCASGSYPDAAAASKASIRILGFRVLRGFRVFRGCAVRLFAAFSSHVSRMDRTMREVTESCPT